jgi:PKD repeat protein
LAATDSIRWTFGDGSSSNQVNPVHTYANAGTYTVCLRIIKYLPGSNTPCIREICKTVVVTQPCTLVVDFNWTVTQTNPLRIEFHNLSTPLAATDSIRWTFGDGTSSNQVNPVHTYANAGTYTVCLRIIKYLPGSNTPCIREICKTVVVTQPCNFNVNFSWRLDSVNNRKVYFTNLTTPPTAAATAVWTFGDGTSATSWNAVHEYAQPGTYRVCLKIYLSPNSNCVREFCDTVYIAAPAPPCNQLSKYHYEKFSNDNQKYKFTPDHINTTFQYTWTFGDGTGSHDPIAIHRYAQPGVYVACLTVWNGPNCASTTCKEINVQPQINCDTSHVSYTYQRNPQVPNRIQFFANGTLPILDQTWTITKLAGGATVTLHQNDPIYLFQDTGYYRVCLRAVMLGGCVKEYCNYIRIEQVSNACTLQAFPNPATTTVNVNVYLTQPQMIHAYVYNSLNVLVLDKNQQGYTGNNLVSMQVNNLPAGQYTIRLIYGNSVCYASFQKL